MTHLTLYSEPWVPGTRVLAYFGEIRSRLFFGCALPGLPNLWEALRHDFTDMAEKRALSPEPNAVVSVEIELDPFGRRDGRAGLSVHAVGTLTRLVRLPPLIPVSH